MVSIINLLLQIARVEAGHLRINPRPLNLKEVTTEAVSVIRSLEVNKQKVEILTDPDPFPEIQLDKDAVGQVIQNLLSNASQYSKKGLVFGFQ